MADYTFAERKHKTVARPREIATGLDHEAVKDYTQLNKEHLTPAVCAALGIDAHEHHHAVGNVDEGTLPSTPVHWHTGHLTSRRCARSPAAGQ